jgi:phenylacetate-CoA ligase
MDSTPSLRQRIYEMLMESQFWSPAQMLEFQRSQLAQLLRHAKATVPFYKTRLDPLFEKNDEINFPLKSYKARLKYLFTLKETK